MAWVEHLCVAEGWNVSAFLREGKARTSISHRAMRQLVSNREPHITHYCLQYSDKGGEKRRNVSALKWTI